MVDNHHNLRLRRIGYCEAEGENSSKQKLFHIPRMTRLEVPGRATLTYSCKRGSKCAITHGICFTK
jgi:hypothetical protein